MTLSAKKHNAAVRMLEEGILSVSEIAQRAKMSEGAVRARRGAKLLDEPLFCHRHKAETSVKVYRANVEDGLPGCVMCAAEKQLERKDITEDDSGDDLEQCQSDLQPEQAKLAKQIRSGEIECIGRRKT